MEKKTYIHLYADECDTETWINYCDIAGAPHSATELIIYFQSGKDIEYLDGNTSKWEKGI